MRANYSIHKYRKPEVFSSFIKDAKLWTKPQDFKSKECFLKAGNTASCKLYNFL